MPHLTHEMPGGSSAAQGGGTVEEAGDRPEHGRGLDARWAAAGADCCVTGRPRTLPAARRGVERDPSQ